jgi:hypothetical protein
LASELGLAPAPATTWRGLLAAADATIDRPAIEADLAAAAASARTRRHGG